MKEHSLKKYLFLAIIILLIVISYFIIKPFLIAVISAFILAFLIKPIYTKLCKTLNRSLSALISVVITLAIIIIPLLLIIQKLLKQISDTISIGAIKLYVTQFFSLPILQNIPINHETLASQIASIVLSFTKSALIQIPKLVFIILITILGIYYILKNWDELSQILQKYIPFENKKEISKEIGEATKKIIFGYLLIALLELIIASIGFKIFGVQNFLLLGLLIGILAFIPGLGPMVIWLPLSLFHLVSQNYITSIGVLIIGLIVGLGIDGILSPKLIGKRSNIHPFVMLIGILGGVSLFGLFGFIIGPLILVYTLKLLEEAMKQS